MESMAQAVDTLATDLKSPRLFLRKLKEQDAADMFEYTSNSECTRHLSWDPHTDIAQTEKFIRSVISRYGSATEYTWGIELTEENKLIGAIRIFDISWQARRGEISYILNPAFQGKGLMYEALKTVMDFAVSDLRLNRIQARCTPANAASENIMKKLGMSYEGTLRHYWMNRGLFEDALLYAFVADHLPH